MVQIRVSEKRSISRSLSPQKRDPSLLVVFFVPGRDQLVCDLQVNVAPPLFAFLSSSSSSDLIDFRKRLGTHYVYICRDSNQLYGSGGTVYQADVNNDKFLQDHVLQRDIPWETYMVTKLISATDLQLLRRYDKKHESARAQLLNEDGPAYVQLFVTILRDIFKEETVEYVLALIYEMLSANPTRAQLFHDQSLAHEDTYEPFLRSRTCWMFLILLLDILTVQMSFLVFLVFILLFISMVAVEGKLVHSREKLQDPCLNNKVFSRSKAGAIANGEASGSKKHITTIDDLLSGLVEWLCAQLRRPSHPTRGAPVAISCLSTLLKEPVVRSSFVQADGVKLLVPLISPASTQQSIQVTIYVRWKVSTKAVDKYCITNSCDLYALDQQLLYETCLCIWLLSYLATSRTMQRLTEVVKSSTKENVVRVVILTFRNLLPKGTFGAQMVDLGLPHIIHSLKTQAWSDEVRQVQYKSDYCFSLADLQDALNQLEEGLKDKIRKLSSFDKYKQEVLLGHLDWTPMHKEANLWRENVTSFEENDFQILRVLLTILDTSSDLRSLSVACYDLSQFIQYHAAGRVIVTDLKAKE
ncbi:hypothetical protein HID58_029737 [Brassica napus]|uniref:ATPase V1 complex subunit H C-terminal domain-containing protein n=1 Tax=Brassica napus TaxID=3708 RepID=A0ABQ8CG48_BRANA|nr:hypothetical protein HID58_029737 [Brassica napus]